MENENSGRKNGRKEKKCITFIGKQTGDELPGEHKEDLVLTLTHLL